MSPHKPCPSETLERAALQLRATDAPATARPSNEARVRSAYTKFGLAGGDRMRGRSLPASARLLARSLARVRSYKSYATRERASSLVAICCARA